MLKLYNNNKQIFILHENYTIYMVGNVQLMVVKVIYIMQSHFWLLITVN